MRVHIIAVGKMKTGPERELADRYFSRAKVSGRPLGFVDFTITELTESRASSAKARKAEEARQILGAVPQNANIVVLDEHGNDITSQKLSQTLGRWRDDGVKHTCFIIGGPDGLDGSVSKAAIQRISFSSLTWPHQMVRIMLMEQLYRTTTILSGHPYHRA